MISELWLSASSLRVVSPFRISKRVTASRTRTDMLNDGVYLARDITLDTSLTSPHPTNNLWDPSKPITFAPSQDGGLLDMTWNPSIPIAFAESPFTNSSHDRRTFTSSAQTNGSSTPKLNVKSMETTKVKRAVAGVSHSGSKTLPIAPFAPTEGPRKAMIPKRPVSLDDDPSAIGKFLEASKLKKEREERERRQQEIRAERARLAQLQQEMRKEAERLEKLRLASLKRVEQVTLEATRMAEMTAQLDQQAAQAQLRMLQVRRARRIQSVESKLSHLRDEIARTRIDTTGPKFFLTLKVKASHEEILGMQDAVIQVQNKADERKQRVKEKREREQHRVIEQERFWKETELDWRMQHFRFQKREEIREVEDMEAEDERIWLEMIQTRSQEEERCRQSELREDYDQLRGVYRQSKAANDCFLKDLLKLQSHYNKVHGQWHSRRTKADESLRDIANEIATSHQFLRAARYTSLRTKLDQIEITQKGITGHIRILTDIAKYRMLFWLYHIGRLKEEESILSIRSHFARRLRQRFNLKSDRTPIRLFADRLTSPFNHYVNSMEDLEKDLRSLFLWNPPSPSRTRVADLPFLLSRLEAEDPDKILRQSSPKVLDIMKQSKALTREAKSVIIPPNLEERLILSKLATRPLVEQYLYLRFDIPLRTFVRKTYAIDKEYEKFEIDMYSLFVKRAGRSVPRHIQRLINRLNKYRWKFIRGTALLTLDIKNETYEHFLRPNVQKRLEGHRDEIIKEREKRFEVGREIQSHRSNMTEDQGNYVRSNRQTLAARRRIEAFNPRRSLPSSGGELKLRGSVGIFKPRWRESGKVKEQNLKRKPAEHAQLDRGVPTLHKHLSHDLPKRVAPSETTKTLAEDGLQTIEAPDLVTTKSHRKWLRTRRLKKIKRKSASHSFRTTDSDSLGFSVEMGTRAKIGNGELGTTSKHGNIHNDKSMSHTSTSDASGSVILSTAFSPSPTHKSPHTQVAPLKMRTDEEGQSETDLENQTSNGGDYVPLIYQIPDDVLQRSMCMSTSCTATYWSHELYRGPHGERILVQYCRSKQSAEKVAQQFTSQEFLGFDIEWKPNAKSTDGIKSNVSLIQLASEDRIGLFHLALYKGDTIEEIMPPILRQILESEDILKCGVAVKGDCSRLKTYLGIEVKGLIELSHIHNLVKFSTSDPKKVNKRLVGLAAQVHEHLRLPLYKGAVRTSDWSKPLNHNQSTYAAADAYASFRLFDALEARRLSMYPVPPRPAYVEDDQPISFPIQLKANRDKEISSVELEDESQDTDHSSEMSGTPSSSNMSADVSDDSDQAHYSDESQDEETSSKFETAFTHDSTNANSASTQSNSNATNSAERIWALKADTSDQEQPQSKRSQLIQAEAWVTEWKNNRRLNSSKPKVTSAALRAYALWHNQSLNVDSIASLLREPPLRKSTVSTYILECLLFERLPFDKARTKMLFNEIPWPVQGRYDSIRRKLQQ